MRATVLIQGDSLSKPKLEYDFHETWPYYLREHFDDVCFVDVATDGKTTHSLHRDSETRNKRELESYNPDIVIVQLGITDCAPRLLRKSETDLINNLPGELLQKLYYVAAKTFRNRSAKRVYTTETEYYENLATYVHRAESHGVKQVVLVKTLGVSETYAQKNPGVGSQIEAYNTILEEVAATSEICETMMPLGSEIESEAHQVDDYTIDDGYHLNSEGQKLIAKRLQARIYKHLSVQ